MAHYLPNKRMYNGKKELIWIYAYITMCCKQKHGARETYPKNGNIRDTDDYEFS